MSLPSLLPPEASPRAVRLRRRAEGLLDRFLHIEAASGVVLILVAVLAMGWANSRWSGTYHAFTQLPVGLSLGEWRVEQTIQFIVNDILMVLFFFVVGLEIRREVHAGELSQLRRAALPLVAALGGMFLPAVLYLALNPSSPTRQGWGVPMATDIAFAVAVLSLGGPRVPSALRVLLLALAVIDDIGAILVIALFYNSGVGFAWLGLGALSLLVLLVMRRFAVRAPLSYVPVGVSLWASLLGAGIHPTLAGVILGLLTPPSPWFARDHLLRVTDQELSRLQEQTMEQPSLALHSSLDRLALVHQEVLSPLARLERALHPWVAFLIMPLFALVNAGVEVGSVDLKAGSSIAVGVGVGLVVGKPLGVLLFSFAAVRLGLCALPRGVGWRGVFLVGLVAGIGFTMAIFVAQLAFDSPDRLAVAKLAVLVASTAVGVLGLLFSRFFLPVLPSLLREVSAAHAEGSTEE